MIFAFEQVFFYLLLFSIPFQRRIILWQQNWYFNEWQSFSFYFTDILLLLLFALWCYDYFSKSIKFLIPRQTRDKFPRETRDKFSKLKNPDFYLVIFVLISAVSVKNAQSTILGLFTIVKMIEFVLFYFYIKYYALLKFDVFYALLALFAGGLFQSVIAILQFVFQSSVGFGLRIFGEGFLKPDLRGVAVFFNNIGQKIMRSYGTTPHPNILAGYLFLSIFSFIAWYFYSKSRYSKKIEWLLLSFWGVMLFAFFTTFSRTVIFIAFAGLCFRVIFIFFKDKAELNKTLELKFRNIMLVCFIATFIFSIFYGQEILSRLSLSSHDEAVAFRLYYGKEALISAVNWFGVGAGNFVNWFMMYEPYHPKWFYQPVHNIYLLIYSETGLIGLVVFSLFLIMLVFNLIQKNRFQLVSMSIFVVFLSFLFIGFFDHFLWTLQQGRLMFWLVLALLNQSKWRIALNNLDR